MVLNELYKSSRVFSSLLKCYWRIHARECYFLNADTLHRVFIQRSTLLVVLLPFWFLVGWLSSPFGSSIQSSSSTRFFVTKVHLGTFRSDPFIRGLFWSHKPRPEPVCSSRPSILFEMAIPFSNRTGVITIPTLALRDKPALLMAEIHQDLFKVIPKAEFAKVVCCVQYMGRTRLHITFASPDRMEDILQRGITIRGHPVTMTPISTKKWVRVSRVPYGVPLASVQQALDTYGDYFITRRETLNNVSTGEISVLMNIRVPIPSKLPIAGRQCIVWYQGQKQTCYLCNSPDHRANTCPKRRTAPPPSGPSFAPVTGAPRPLSPRSLMKASAITPASPGVPPSPKTPSRPTSRDVFTPSTPVVPSSIPLPVSPEPPGSAEFSQDSDFPASARQLASPVLKKSRIRSPQGPHSSGPPGPSKSTQSPSASTQSPLLDSPLLGCPQLPVPRDTTEPRVEMPPDPIAMEDTNTPTPNPPKVVRTTRRHKVKHRPNVALATLRKKTRPTPVCGSRSKPKGKKALDNISPNRFALLRDELVNSEEFPTYRVTASGNIASVTPPPPAHTIPNKPFPVSGPETQ